MNMNVFIDLHSKGESVTVNAEKILFLYARKNGTRLELEDGTPFDVDESYENIRQMLKN